MVPAADLEMNITVGVENEKCIAGKWSHSSVVQLLLIRAENLNKDGQSPAGPGSPPKRALWRLARRLLYCPTGPIPFLHIYGVL